MVAAYGSVNKGKTFILSKLIKKEMPSGYNIRTPGICVMYPRPEAIGIRVIVLDTAGAEQPIQTYSNEIMGLLGSNMHDQDKHNELLAREFNDRILMQDFNQKFICGIANCVLIVVNTLTFADQKMLLHLI